MSPQPPPEGATAPALEPSGPAPRRRVSPAAPELPIRPGGSLRLPVRRLYIALLALGALGALLAAALGRSEFTPARPVNDERSRIIDGATGLLTEHALGPQGILPVDPIAHSSTNSDGPAHSIDPGRSAMPVGVRDEPPGAAAPLDASNAALGSAASDPAAALAPLRDLVRNRTHPDLRSLVKLSAAESEALGGGSRHRPATGAAPGAVQRSPPLSEAIPDAIEGTVAAPQAADALAPYTVTAALLLREADAPFTLREIRLAPAPARARFASRNRETAAGPSYGWMELGESPLPGWRLIRIQPQSVTLISPLGNPVRMAVTGAESIAGAALPADPDRRTAPER